MVTAQHHRKQKISLDDVAWYYMRLRENTSNYFALRYVTLHQITLHHITLHETPSLSHDVTIGIGT